MEDVPIPAAPPGDSPPILACPVCKDSCQGEREFIRHLERHRPVDGPRRGLSRCSRGCGRFLPGREMPGHSAVCDGEGALVPVDLVPRQKAKYKRACKFCGEKFWRLGGHVRVAHPDKAG